MHNGIQLARDEDVVGDVVADEGEVFVAAEVGDVFGFAGDEVIHADDLVAFFEEEIAEVGTEESGSAGDEYTHVCSEVGYRRILALEERWWGKLMGRTNGINLKNRDGFKVFRREIGLRCIQVG